MLKYQTRIINDELLDIVCTTSSDGTSQVLLQTRPENTEPITHEDGSITESTAYDGFTAEKKYMVNLPTYNPKTLIPFTSDNERIEFVQTLSVGQYMPYSEPQESSEEE